MLLVQAFSSNNQDLLYKSSDEIWYGYKSLQRTTHFLHMEKEKKIYPTAVNPSKPTIQDKPHKPHITLTILNSNEKHFWTTACITLRHSVTLPFHCKKNEQPPSPPPLPTHPPHGLSPRLPPPPPPTVQSGCVAYPGQPRRAAGEWTRQV